jgi:acetyltransferase
MTPVESGAESGAVTVQLRDGTSVMLRAVRPEDEPLLQELLESCSPKSLHHLFQYVTKRTHDMAFKFCHIDESREKVIVAEIESGGNKKLIGFGDLAADASHRSVEVAILVADGWQGKGLGSALSKCCLDVAYRWGVEEIVAVTTPDNWRVITMAQKRRFRAQVEQGTVVLNKKFHRRRDRLAGKVA